MALLTPANAVLEIANQEPASTYTDYSDAFLSINLVQTRNVSDTTVADGSVIVAAGKLRPRINSFTIVLDATLTAALKTAMEADEVREVNIYTPDKTSGSTKYVFDIVPSNLPLLDYDSNRDTVPTLDIGAYISGSVTTSTVS